MKRFSILAGLAFWATALLHAAGAQNLLPNGNFESGGTAPTGWALSSGASGQWVAGGAHTGHRCLMIQGQGKGSGYWHSTSLPLIPGKVYRLSFWGRRDPATSGGCIVSGPASVNRDFHFSENWQPYQFIFTLPVHATNEFIRLGQWEQKGAAWFDDASLTTLLPVHSRPFPGWELGQDESIENGAYQCRIQFSSPGGNYSRVLHESRCGFNSDRWTFSSGSSVTYRHHAPGGFASARVQLAINYHVAGSLQVEASQDARQWQPVGHLDGSNRTAELEIPSAALSGNTLFLRLTGQGQNCNLQVNHYHLAAPLKQPVPDAVGQTLFFELLAGQPEVEVQLAGLAKDPATATHELLLHLHNRSAERLDLRADLWWPQNISESVKLPTLAPGQQSEFRVPLRPPQPGENPFTLTLATAARRPVFAASAILQVGVLADPRPGYWLAQTRDLGLWWCESGWKIGRERPLPNRPAAGAITPVTISAARGEYEAAQVVLRPSAPLELSSISIGPLRDRRGRLLQPAVQWLEVAYVRVTRPTDATCEPGWYPDPLPPLELPLKLSPGQNQPLWLNLFIPTNAPAGEFRGEILLQTSAGRLRVPVQVTVYDFTLPPDSHLRSAFGLNTSAINRYHHLTNAEQRLLVYEKYLTNFAQHRISPYSFFTYSPIQVRFTGAGADKPAQVDFTAFEQAARRWLDQHRFNSFLLPLRGMGGGTFHSRALGELEGFKEGTPEHLRLFSNYLGQVVHFLQQKGWLDKAYAYWFDEPDPKDYPFVVEGMKRIKSAAPGLKRMLTEQPEPELLGHVDIWCGLTPEWTPEKVAARRAAGEEVWWYICCAPRAPYLTEFIDHPGLELRLWPWQSWQYGVQGILVWETTYWTSAAAFTPPRQQNPWEDPMSYVSGYDYQPGQIGYWGNGDGRFLYPPRAAMTNSAPCLDGPVTSLRWENLRDGMEDYEYFHMLQQAVARLKTSGRQPELRQQAEALLQIPPDISRDTRQFTTDARLLLQHRARLARMIERLQSL